MAGPISYPTSPDRDRPRMTGRAWLWFAWSVGRLLVMVPPLILATILAAAAASRRIMLTLTDRWPLLLSDETRVKLTIALFALIGTGLYCLAWRHLMSRMKSIDHQLRVARGDSPASDAAADPLSSHHLDQEPAR